MQQCSTYDGKYVNDNVQRMVDSATDFKLMYNCMDQRLYIMQKTSWRYEVGYILMAVYIKTDWWYARPVVEHWWYVDQRMVVWEEATDVRELIQHFNTYTTQCSTYI